MYDHVTIFGVHDQRVEADVEFLYRQLSDNDVIPRRVIVVARLARIGFLDIFEAS